MAKPRTGAAVSRFEGAPRGKKSLADDAGPDKKAPGKKAAGRNPKGKRIWYGRITFYDDEGKLHRRERRADNKTHAREVAREMLQELEERGQVSLDAATMTFSQLADYYKTTYVIDPVYVDDRKVAGLRSKYDVERRLGILKTVFGRHRVRTITHGDIERYRSARLAAPIVVKNKKGVVTKTAQRSIATVNRELSILRRVFNVAVRNGWLLRNPIDCGHSLIAPGDEKPRERILTREEEDRLLAVCGPPRAHLRPILICALDTGMRRGEILKLKWSDVDFAERAINILALNTKTLRQRQVAMTARLAAELDRMWSESAKRPDDLVFGVTGSVRQAFRAARKLAGLPGVRFHDLRHTCATKLVAAQIPLSEVGRILGHNQPITTYRYVNANVETARRAAAALDRFNEVPGPERVPPGAIN
jgi:integrase